jgi:hypothetical protein
MLEGGSGRPFCFVPRSNRSFCSSLRAAEDRIGELKAEVEA